MVLVLCIGDMHVPHRSVDLPPKFRKLLVPGKVQHVVCTGDLCTKESYDYLRGLCPYPGNVHVVHGVYDALTGVGGGVSSNDTFPESRTLQVGDFAIGVTHGHQIVPWGDVDSLSAHARKLNVDVLVTGHTHCFASHKVDGKLLLNPGSATGSSSFENEQPNPSFVLMDVNGSSLVAYVYELVGDEVKVDKIEWSK